MLHSRWRYLITEHIDGVSWRQLRPLLTDTQVQAAHRTLAETLLGVLAAADIVGHDANPLSIAGMPNGIARGLAASQLGDEMRCFVDRRDRAPIDHVVGRPCSGVGIHAGDRQSVSSPRYRESSNEC